MIEDSVISFLIRAKKETYAASRPADGSSRCCSYDLMFEEGEYKYLDSYFGSHLFSGQEVIWKNDVPIWAMNYVGRVLSDQFDSKFLKEALQHPTIDLPYRGKNFYQSGDYTYIFEVCGEFSWFKGREIIFYQDELVYELELHGGVIFDQRLN